MLLQRMLLVQCSAASGRLLEVSFEKAVHGGPGVSADPVCRLAGRFPTGFGEGNAGTLQAPLADRGDAALTASVPKRCAAHFLPSPSVFHSRDRTSYARGRS